jgi:hypothetical protein
MRTAFALVTLVMVSAIPLYAGSMGTSGGHDLDRLWSRAQERFDPSTHDAILLLENRHVTILPNGGKRTKIHRVVWIGTGVVVRTHADLRIAHNTATSTLSVTALRTWRDDRWWPDETAIKPSAVVETLPFALALADDYTAMRETMLLHDGVELPCIMETTYEIEERGGARDGADGLWVFPQRDPAALVEFRLSIPPEVSFAFHSGNGAPEPITTSDAGQTVTWTMEDIGPVGSPSITDPASYAPYVVWSTWKDWKTLGDKIVSSFDDAAILGEALADTLAARLAHEPSALSKARAIVAFVDESTRSIHYDARFWSFSPRAASRTWETAYGHGFDRAVLATALFREAGLDAEPVYRSTGSSGIDIDIPGLSRFDDIGVWVSGERFAGFYDPADGHLTDGPWPLPGRVVWRPRSESKPSMQEGVEDPASRFDLVITLEPAEDGGWSGNGFLRADGRFSPHGDMVGLGGEALSRIGEIAESVLTGATVEGFNPEVFEPDQVTVGFDITAKAGEPDDHGRTSITIGEPAGGIMAHLPSDVRLYHENRGSPVTLPGRMAQRIRLRLKTGDREIIYLPQSRVFENEVGRYTLSTKNKDGWVTIDREITVGVAAIPAEAWPGLRELLLEETDAAGGTLLMEKSRGEKESVSSSSGVSK